MTRINEDTATDLKVIERLQQLGWKRGDTLLYQQEYALSQEHQKMFDGKKSIKPDMTLTDIHRDILAVIENKSKVFILRIESIKFTKTSNGRRDARH